MAKLKLKTPLPVPKVRYHKRRVVNVDPPLSPRDQESLNDLMARINSGKTFFLGTRFTHRGSVVTISKLEKM